MPSIFDDERRPNGGFSRGPSGVGPKSPLALRAFSSRNVHWTFRRAEPDKRVSPSKMLDGGRHRLALFSCSGAILDTNAAIR